MSNTYKILTCSALSILLTACSNNRQSNISVTPVEFRNHRSISQTLYTVQEGDTVGSVANTHGMTRTELIQKNNLSAPYELLPGQKLIIKTNGVRPMDTKSSKNTESLNVSIVQEGGLETEYSSTKHEVSKPLLLKAEPSLESTSLVQLGSEKETDIVEVEKTIASTNDYDELSSSYVWPVASGRKRISKAFDSQSGNILISTPGRTPVKAIADGIVKMAGKSGNEQLVRFGNMIVIQHKPLNKVSIYANVIDLKVKTGQLVSAGDTIASVGQTGIRGMTTEPVLYFEIDQTGKGKKRRPIDPCEVLP